MVVAPARAAMTDQMIAALTRSVGTSPPHSCSRIAFGRAWTAMTIALAAHVTDEALTDFLSVYNPIVRAARERFAWLPIPTFTFGVWLTGLAGLIVALLMLAPLAYRRSALTPILA